MFKGTFQTLQSTTGLAAVGTECGPLYLLTLGGNLEVGQPAAKKCDALTGVLGTLWSTSCPATVFADVGL